MNTKKIHYQNLSNEYILSQIPKKYLISVIESIESAYQSAHRKIHEEFDKPLAEKYYPIIRPAYIDQEIKLITENFEAVTSTFNPNSIKNSLHAEVFSGDFVITFSKVNHRNEIVRKAIFRETLAQDNQLGFLELSKVEQLDAKKIYALITHIPNPINQEKPISINFAIPTPDCSNYVRNISLYDLTGYGSSSGGVSTESDIDPIEPTIITPNKTDSKDS